METAKEDKSPLRKAVDALYGGINMTWPKVLLFAVGTAVLTTVFLVFPVFKNTSFERMGVTFEAWIFFALIIIANCDKPLESALKTFVFFLVSQPLIYLFQVPSSELGWGIFGYYGYWFIWTLLTFPMAFIGWYIKRKDWISLLILSPALIALVFYSANSFVFAFAHFPLQLVTALFCLLQVLVYLYAFTSNVWQKAIGFAVPVVITLTVFLVSPQADINATVFLPDDPVLSESAVVQVENPDVAQIEIESTGTDSMIRVHASSFGTTDFSIQDGNTEYLYTANIYQDDTGSSQIDITQR